MRQRQWLLFLLLVMPGTAGFCFCMYYALIDWALLQKTYANFEHLAGTSPDMKTLFVAEAEQNIHRINFLPMWFGHCWALSSQPSVSMGYVAIATIPDSRRSFRP